MASLSLKGIGKRYPNGFEAVKDFNLEIEDQEFIIFVGPSGSLNSVNCFRFLLRSQVLIFLHFL